MKTLVQKETNVSLYLFADDEAVSVGAGTVEVGNPLGFVIADCNAENAVLHEGVTPPADWFGHKYLFDGADWSVNPDFVEPA